MTTKRTVLSLFIALLFAVVAQPAIADSGSGLSALNGEKVVPPVQTEAAGLFSFNVVSGGNMLEITLCASNISDVNSVQIHRGSDDETGPAVITVCGGDSGRKCTNLIHDNLLIREYITELDNGDPVSSIAGDLASGDYYVDVDTAAYPNGEIRGQIRSGFLPWQMTDMWEDLQ